MNVSAEKAAKVHDLVDSAAVCLVEGWEERAAVVHGHTGYWTVRAYKDGLACDCPAGREGACSHALAAMVVWAEYQARAETPFGRAVA